MKIKNILIGILSILSTSSLVLSYAKYKSVFDGVAGENKFLDTVYSIIDPIYVSGAYGNAGPTGVDHMDGDNITAVYDGDNTFSDDTKKRWTNWSSNTEDRGKAVALTFKWSTDIYIDNIVMNLFIDANGCDFPKVVSFIEDFECEGDSNGYIIMDSIKGTKITNFVETRNYTSAVRESDSVYLVSFTDGTTGKFIWSYKGKCPAHTYTFTEKVKTNNLTILIEPKDGWFIGLTELEFFNEGVLLELNLVTL